MGGSGSGSGSYHFVLVHGLGHGAWCWYKVAALLEAAGHTVTALDLAGAGIHKAIAGTITSVAEYVAPLTDFLAHSVVHQHQVILVGHSLGGSVISYAMELFPEKISKAVFLSGFMPISGEYFLDLEIVQALVSLDAFKLIYGADEPESISKKPIAICINNAKATEFFYNKCSLEDVRLARACLNETPFSVTEEKLHLTTQRYGSLPRYHIKCLQDNSIPSSDQEHIILCNPPQKVFTIPNSDHSSFFCVPDILVQILLEIALC